MTDRIEELLRLLAAEDEEEREDVFAQKRGKAVSEGAWTGARASDGVGGPRDQPEPEGKRPSGLTALQRDNGAAKPRVANRRSVTTEKRGKAVSEGAWFGAGASDGAIGPRDQPETEGKRPSGLTALQRDNIAVKPGVANRRRVTTGEITSEQPDLMAGELWGIEPAWAVRSGTSGPALESAAQAGLAQTGLKGLYRQTVRGLRPAAPALPPDQAGRTARAQEPGSAASLAVEELDRAVRRDSRRYDGGMSIY